MTCQSLPAVQKKIGNYTRLQCPYMTCTIGASEHDACNPANSPRCVSRRYHQVKWTVVRLSNTIYRSYDTAKNILYNNKQKSILSGIHIAARGASYVEIITMTPILFVLNQLYLLQDIKFVSKPVISKMSSTLQ